MENKIFFMCVALIVIFNVLDLAVEFLKPRDQINNYYVVTKDSKALPIYREFIDPTELKK